MRHKIGVWKHIRDMAVGEVGYVTPWTVHVWQNRAAIRGDATYQDNPGGTATVRVERTANGVRIKATAKGIMLLSDREPLPAMWAPFPVENWDEVRAGEVPVFDFGDTARTTLFPGGDDDLIRFGGSVMYIGGKPVWTFTEWPGIEFTLPPHAAFGLPPAMISETRP